MPSLERSALVPYSPEQMFALIADIERYPEFMADCAAATVDERGVTEQSVPFVEATLTIQKVGFKQSFTTRNLLFEPHTMRLNLVRGPFSKLEGEWRFEALGEAEQQACKVIFTMDYAFPSRMLGLVAGPIFEKSAEDQVRNLVERARELYGT